MKKIVTLIATLAVCLSLGTVALAASPDSPSAGGIDIGTGNGGDGSDSNYNNGGNHGGSDTEGANTGDNGNGSGNNSGSGNGTGNGSGSGNGANNGESSPKTSDSYLVPGLATVALGGTVITVVSKKKMNSEK